MKFADYTLAIFPMLGVMWDKIRSVFSTSNTLISDEAIELLNDPSTREEFIEFATGIDNKGNKNINDHNTVHTFTRRNGKKITVMKFS